MNIGQEIIQKHLNEILQSPNANSSGVYRMIGEDEEILYIGKAKNLSNRIKNYIQSKDLSDRIRRMVFLTRSLEIITTKTESEALILEANLIYNLQPRFNILLKDDKSFPYIYLRQDHDFPQICKYRGKKTTKSQHYGPFASAQSVTEVVGYLQKIFLLRPCSDSYFSNRTRPCLQYQIKRCSAPCVDKISKIDYAKLVQQAKDFLDGKVSDLQKNLAKIMQEASDKMEFEKAAIYRDRIKLLTKTQASQEFVNAANFINADLFAISKEFSASCIQVFFIRNGQNYGNQDFFPIHSENDSESSILTSFIVQFYQKHMPASEIILSHHPENVTLLEKTFSKSHGHAIKISSPQKGPKAKFMEFISQNAHDALLRKRSKEKHYREIFNKLEEIFKVDHKIEKIEIYDNSHISGSHAIGAMVASNVNGFDKKNYRKFNIQTTKIGDDYQMMREVFTRRLKRLENVSRNQWPSLVIIDGGRGHLNAVIEVVKPKFFSVIKFISIAKSPKRNAGNETFFIFEPNEPVKIRSVKLENSNPVMKYLQILRDESHRYAITTHRKKRSMSISFLEKIPQIGKKRKESLLNHFTNFEEIKLASIEDLERVEGISKMVAKEIYDYLHG